LPQILSTALASTLANVGKSNEVAGPSVADLTRLALSPYEMWSDIFVTNLTHISGAIDIIVDKLRYLQQNLTSEEMQGIFRVAHEAASQVRKKN
jgi:prephenate dehydrogenase